MKNSYQFLVLLACMYITLFHSCTDPVQHPSESSEKAIAAFKNTSSISKTEGESEGNREKKENSVVKERLIENHYISKTGLFEMNIPAQWICIEKQSKGVLDAFGPAYQEGGMPYPHISVVLQSGGAVYDAASGQTRSKPINLERFSSTYFNAAPKALDHSTEPVINNIVKKGIQIPHLSFDGDDRSWQVRTHYDVYMIPSGSDVFIVTFTCLAADTAKYLPVITSGIDSFIAGRK